MGKRAPLPPLLQKLRTAIFAADVPGDINRTRYYARNILKMKGDEFRRISQWFRNPSSMTAEDTARVEAVLDDKDSSAQKAARVAPSIKSGSTMTQEITDHTISVINSLSDLVSRSGMDTSIIRAGDRLQLQGAVQKICTTYGVSVHFGDDKPKRS